MSNAASILARPLRALHRDERGNIGILLLLTVWALVALLAMVWNSAEYATRRRHVQGAADATVHSAHVWVSRTTNLTTASNLVIGQNGSAEVILRAVPPTREHIQNRFDAERRRATQLLTGQRPGEPEENYPDTEYFDELVGTGAWSGNGRGQRRMQELSALSPDVIQAMNAVLPLLPPQQRQPLQRRVADALRRNDLALKYLVDVYVGQGGNTTGNSGGAGGPVGVWIDTQVRPRLIDILTTLDQEQVWLDQFVAQTDPAVSSTTPRQLADRRREIHDYQQEIRRLTPTAIEEQQRAVASMYKVEVTSGVPGRQNESGLPTLPQAPIETAGVPEGRAHVDSIRQRYPDQTARRFGSDAPDVWIDPINVNVGHSAIWHPGVMVPTPPGITLAGQTYTDAFRFGGGEWGRVPCAPLSRYINGRVSRDREALRAEPQAIDNLRSALRGRIHPPPEPPVLLPLPNNIPDTEPDAQPIPLPPERIPQIPAPAELPQATMAFVNEVNRRSAEYDRNLRDYVSDLRRLINSLARMHGNLENLTDSSSQRFADSAWLNFVNSNRDLVLRQMGSEKSFMVLATYGLRPIPEWAVADMRSDVYRHVYQEVYSRSMSGLTQGIRNRLASWAFGVLTAGQGNNPAARQQAQQFANANAPRIAQYAARLAASQIAAEVAEEWVRRPWPYEIEPPDRPTPPPPGIRDEDRLKHFTSMAAAVTGDESSPRTLFDGVFTPAGSNRLVSFAQAETFNWNEFAEGYGRSDAYDRLTHYGHGDEGGSPRPWRLSTVGGWNWQSKLARSDALAPTLRDTAQFRSFMEEGGVTPNGDDTNFELDPITLH